MGVVTKGVVGEVVMVETRDMDRVGKGAMVAVMVTVADGDRSANYSVASNRRSLSPSWMRRTVQVTFMPGKSFAHVDILVILVG